MVLFRLAQDKCAQQFLSTSLLGELVSVGPDDVTLKDVCMVHEVMGVDAKRNSTVNTVYFTNSLVSEGVLVVKNENIAFRREVSEDELIMKGYRDAFVAYRQEKAGLSKVNTKIVAPNDPQSIRSN